jgi:hypothetical protein
VSTTTFLSNDTLWQALAARIKGARHVDAAIAFFGQGGATLLPLRKGDRFIVDMSVATVRGGGTDPREVEKLIRRGVQVFTRRNLHAKVVVADQSVISGSANVSNRSHNVLDEAAILTSDPTTVRRAREFIDRLCTEPVRPEYLKKCKKLYRPPDFNEKPGNGKQGQHRTTHAKLWVVPGLREFFVPDSEMKRWKQGELKAEKRIKDEIRSSTDSINYAYKPKMASELEPGDWIIMVMARNDKSKIVYPPGQLLSIDHYIRDAESGKERWVFHLEIPKRGETITWTAFRRAANLQFSRSRAIRDVPAADKLLRLWTTSGRIAKRKGKK